MNIEEIPPYKPTPETDRKVDPTEPISKVSKDPQERGQYDPENPQKKQEDVPLRYTTPGLGENIDTQA